MESDAKAYSQLNKMQYDMGCNFIRSLNLSKGAKVLDMGCGTGEVTKFIADVVGHDGEVVGVDPDEARIKIAQEKFKDVENVKFVVGNSVTGFPHDNDEYYDLHFSTSVFHWVPPEEKKLYVEKAYQCLKQGGRIAILAALKFDNPMPVLEGLKISVGLLTEEEYKKLVKDVGQFTNLKTNITSFVSRFASYDEFAAWFKASTHEEVDPAKDWAKEFLARFTSTEADGRFKFEMKDLGIEIVGAK